MALSFDDLLAHCLAKPGAWQDEPWEDDVVATVGPTEAGKIGWESA